MKKKLVLFSIIYLLIPGFLKGQNQEIKGKEFKKKEIFVLGTFHFRKHDFNKYPQDISKEIKRGIGYKPDIVLVEWMQKSEAFDIYNIDYSKHIEDLLKKTNLDTTNAYYVIESLYQRLYKNPDLIENRAKLATYLYVTRDYINACYQWYLIEKNTENKENFKTLLPEDIDTYRRNLYVDQRNQKREIVELAFPIAKALGHEKIYSIDYRHDQIEYGGHINKFIERFKSKYGYDPLLKKTEPIQMIMDEWLEADRLNNTSTYYEKLNSKEFERLLFNYYFDLFFSYSHDPDYRKWHELQLERRNWKIFELLIQSIYESNALRIFVLLGSTHKIYLERFLNESSLFRVIHYADFE